MKVESVRGNEYTHPYRRAIIGTATLTMLVSAILYSQTMLSSLLSYVVAINVVSFCAMGFDKRAALHEMTRIPELVFGLLALVGGSLGVLVAMLFFRHKTQKRRFQLIFAAAIVIQALVLYPLRGHIPTGLGTFSAAFER